MFMFEYMVTHGYPQIAGKAFFKGTGDQREVPSLCHAPCGSDLQIWLLVEDFEKKLGQNDPWDVGKQLVVRVYIYLSFQILQICRVQTKTLGLAVIMLKTLGLSQKTGFSYKLSEFDIVLASNTSPTLLHHMFLRFSSIQPYRQETTSTLYIWSREKRNPNMEKYGSGIQASSKPCSTRDLPVSTRVFLRNTQGL